MDYDEREQLLRERYSARACRIKIGKSGPHQFGGTRRDLKITGVKLPKPIHHFLTLDTRDPLCPVESDRFTKLPLVYPLLYGAGGGQIQYSVVSDTEIAVHHLSECYPDDPYVDHKQLPESRASLLPLSYGEERILCALHGLFYRRRLSFADRMRLKWCDDGEIWRVGGHFETCQGTVWSLCTNPRCDWRDGCGGDTKSQIHPIALILATKRQLGDVWGQYSSDVEFFFGFCPHCGAIHAENRCT
jgi:hypothetical protein